MKVVNYVTTDRSGMESTYGRTGQLWWIAVGGARKRDAYSTGGANRVLEKGIVYKRSLRSSTSNCLRANVSIMSPLGVSKGQQALMLA